MGIRSNDDDGSSFDFDNAAALRNDPISAMLWANNYSGGGNPGLGGTLFSIWGGSDRAWRISASDSPLEYRARISTTGADQLSVSSNTTIDLDRWYLVGMDYDGTDINFWLDGVLDAGPGNQPGGLHPSVLDMAIPGQAGGANLIDAATADARVYNRILTSAEWQTIFASQGNDGIVHGLLFRSPQNDREPGTLVSAKSPVDVGPSKIGFAASFGTPVSNYEEGPGFGIR